MRARENRPYRRRYLRLSYIAANREKYETDSNLFVKLTTSSNQWIGKFQIINGERARGIRRKKRDTLFSKQHWLDVIFGVF